MSKAHVWEFRTQDGVQVFVIKGWGFWAGSQTYDWIRIRSPDPDKVEWRPEWASRDPLKIAERAGWELVRFDPDPTQSTRKIPLIVELEFPDPS